MLRIVSLFVRLKVHGAQNIVSDGSPAVFVGNHGSIEGPVANGFYLPVPFRPWINVAMIDREMAEKTISHTFEGRRFLIFGGKAKHAAISLAARLLSSVASSLDPVPVSRTDKGAMLGTLKTSVETLERGVNLLIFPENPGSGKYGDESFRDLHPAFALLGRLYYGRTGRRLRFYPVFTNMGKKTYNIGSPVVYTPGGDEKAEVDRIVSGLRDALVRMSSL